MTLDNKEKKVIANIGHIIMHSISHLFFWLALVVYMHFLPFYFLLTFIAYLLYSPLSNRLGSLSLLIVCLFFSLLVICHIGNWKGGLMSYLEEFESRSKGSTTLRAIGLRSTPN